MPLIPLEDTPKKFVIDRSKWRSGGSPNNFPGGAVEPIGEGKVKMLNEQGYMCCLGQMCAQVGVPAEILTNYTGPTDIRDGHGQGLALLFERKDGKVLKNRAIEINDYQGYTLVEREKALTELFEEYGVTLEFIGEAHPTPAKALNKVETDVNQKTSG